MRSTPSRLLLVLALVAPCAAGATPLALAFTAITTSVVAGTPYPAVGTPLAGTYTFDYDAAAFVAVGDSTIGPGYRAYTYDHPPYGLSMRIGATTVPSLDLAIEVFDNGSTLLGFPSDTVTVSTKIANVFYSLVLTGPNGAFTGVTIPSPDVLRSFWTSATFVVLDNNLMIGGGPTLSARVTGVTIGAVPEPGTALLAPVGLAAALAARKRRGGPRRTARPQ